MRYLISLMMGSNPGQKEAVDTLEGPVMVIAGPGNGQDADTRCPHRNNPAGDLKNDPVSILVLLIPTPGPWPCAALAGLLHRYCVTDMFMVFVMILFRTIFPICDKWHLLQYENERSKNNKRPYCWERSASVDGAHPRYSLAADESSRPFALAPCWRLSPVSTRELGGAALIGVTMLVTSQALAIWGTHFLPAGSPRCSARPRPLPGLVRVGNISPAADTPRGRRRRHRLRRPCGDGLTSATGGDFRPIGAVLTVAASAAWAAGSLLSPRLTLPRDPVIGLTVQFAMAGMVLSAIVTVTGITATTDLAGVPLQVWGALTFLIVASTLIGYAVFLALNAKISSTIAKARPT